MSHSRTLKSCSWVTPVLCFRIAVDSRRDRCTCFVTCHPFHVFHRFLAVSLQPLIFSLGKDARDVPVSRNRRQAEVSCKIQCHTSQRSAIPGLFALLLITVPLKLFILVVEIRFVCVKVKDYWTRFEQNVVISRGGEWTTSKYSVVMQWLAVAIAIGE